MAKLHLLDVAPALVICCLSALTVAQNITQPSPQSEVHELVGWHHNPDQRGTMNILDSCLFTIVACTWTIHHPNVPGEEPETWLAKFLHKVKWMTLTVLLPEFILAQAVDEYLWVREIWKNLSISKAARGGLGGLVFKMTYKENYDWSKKHCYYANMGGFRVNLLDINGGDASNRKLYPLTAKELVRYLESSDQPDAPEPIPSSWPPAPLATPRAPISETHIERMIKRDSFAKAIAFFQISWIIISVLARWAIHLPTSQLEIITAAFATCAILTYLLRWNKPQNVEVWTPIPNQAKDLGQLFEPQRFFNVLMSRGGQRSEGPRLPHFRNDTIRPFQINRSFLPCLVIFMMVVGALHLVAWNFSFPSAAERELWRYSVLSSVGIPLVLLISASLLPKFIVWISNVWHSKKRIKDAQDFLIHCYWALASLQMEKRESDSSDEKVGKVSLEELDQGLRDLKSSFSSPSKYRDVLPLPVLSSLHAHIRRHRMRFMVHIHRDFPEKFDQLHSLLLQELHNPIDQDILPKLFDGSDATDVFPGLSAKQARAEMRQWILTNTVPVIGVLYSIARLVIIAIAFSSLREMPSGVYEATWSRYLPNFQ